MKHMLLPCVFAALSALAFNNDGVFSALGWAIASVLSMVNNEMIDRVNLILRRQDRLFAELSVARNVTDEINAIVREHVTPEQYMQLIEAYNQKIVARQEAKAAAALKAAGKTQWDPQ
jgi:hypothetical protein